MSRRSTSEFSKTGPQDHTGSNSPSSILIHNLHTGPVYEETLEMVDIINDPDCPRAGKHRELDKAEVEKGQFSSSLLLSRTSLIISPSQIRTSSAPWFLVLPSPWKSRWTCSERKLCAGLLKLTSSDTYRAESQDVSSTLSRRRNSRPWRLATRSSPSYHPRET